MQINKDLLHIVMGRAQGDYGFEVIPEYCVGGKQDNLCRALGPGGVCMVMIALAEINGLGLYPMSAERAQELLEKYLYGQRGSSRVTPAAVGYCQAHCAKSDWENIRAGLIELGRDDVCI